MRDHAFDTLGKRGVVSLIGPANTLSRGVAIKIGMTLVGEVGHAGLPHLTLCRVEGAGSRHESCGSRA